MQRRSFLKALIYLSASAKVLTLAPARAAPARRPRRFIDVHCHFFNAADLPVRGFLERVALADYTVTQSLQGSAVTTPSVWHGMAAKLADLILRRRAPTPQQELECLKGTACTGFALSSPRVATRSLGQSAQSTADGRLLGEILQSHYEKPATRSIEPSPQARSEAEVDAFVDFVLKEMKASGEAAPEISSRSFRSIGPSSRGVIQSVADYIASGRSFFSRYFSWAEVLTNYRANIAATYQSLYDPKKSRLVLATPALVDYNFWLDDQSPSPIRDQIELMAHLSLRSDFPIHGFAPFDPLREIRRAPSDPSSLEIVQEAVRQHGFLGAKLYSPMGFRPSGNAELGFRFPASSADIDHTVGKRLDQALDSLYAWCQKEEAAILAHTTDSQSAGPEFASRAEPKFWRSVLEKYPTLRLNLAHFGNFTQAFAPNSDVDPETRFDKTWEYEIGTFIKSGRFPHVYADISYFYWVLEGGEDKKKLKAVKAMFKRYFETFDRDVTRLMFGTDWNMIAKAQGFGGYVDATEGFFRDIGLNEAQLDRLFYKNALNYLGLQGSPKVSARLKAFYAAGEKPYPKFVSSPAPVRRLRPFSWFSE